MPGGPRAWLCDGLRDQASSIFPVVSDYLETGSAAAEAIIEQLIRGLLHIAQRDGQGLLFPGSTYFPAGWESPAALAAGPHDHRQDATRLEGDPAYYGRLLIPFTKYAQLTGSRAALELCEGLAYNIVYQSKRYAPDGGFSRAPFGEASVWTSGHFHSRFATAAGLVRCGRLSGKQEYIDFARLIFEWGLKRGLQTGWFPEFAGRQTPEEGCETCTITDAIDLAVQFGQLGDPEAWALAERFAANQLVESQVWDIDFCDHTTRRADTEMASFERVAERASGGFAGWSAPNDLISNYNDPGWDTTGKQPELRRTLMDCCGGYGNRGLYLAWHNALTQNNGVLSVNMLLSRRTKELTVEALMPARDLLRLTLHAERAVRVRVPATARKLSAATPEGRALEARVQGGYLVLGTLPAGTRIELSFGCQPRRESVTVGEKGLTQLKEYQVEWLGDRVIGVNPAGGIAALYNHRQAILGCAAPQASCHLPPKEIDW